MGRHLGKGRQEELKCPGPGPGPVSRCVSGYPRRN